MNLQPDTKEALRFLEAFRPGGPWVLTAISEDQKDIETETFTDLSAAEIWIADRNGQFNAYFNVNPVLKLLTSKAKKTDVRGMAWLHVDVDPRADLSLKTDAEKQKHLDMERSRIEKLLFTFDPPPTVIVDSGGGYQGFWKLDEEQPVNGDENRAIELEAYNLQLELLLGADSCHNLDRIMRLPGTINLPNEKKRKKGRIPALAMVVKEAMGVAYPLSTFMPAKRAAGGASGSGPRATISDNLPHVELDDLPISERVKSIIRHGDGPDKPYPSQSEAVFKVCLEMVRARCTEDQIATVMLDRDFGISAHIYRQARPKDYTARQIRRATEEVISPELRKLNDEHFVILNDGGKCRVCEWISDKQRKRLSFQSFEDFRNRYMNVNVEEGTKNGEPVFRQLGKFWLGHSQRRQYKRLVFFPGGEEVIEGSLNLWQGWGIEPKPGQWPLLKAHVVNVLAEGDPWSATYILKWTAWALQHPGEPAEVAMVFKGKSGTGKGTWARTIRRVYGQHGMQVTSHLHLAGRFNAHLRDVCLLFADEAILPGDKAAEKILYGMLTEDELTIEGKGKDAVTAPNHVKVIMASNEKWVVPANMQDRRFAVFQVSELHMKDEAYFKCLNAEIDSGGAAAMLHDLLDMNLGDWHPRRDIPDTHARNQQKLATMGGFAAVFHDMLAAGELPVGKAHQSGWFVGTTAMQSYCQKYRHLQISTTEIGDFFNGLGFVKQDKRPRGYILPPLPAARAAWDQKMVPAVWDAATEWEESPPPF